jgi:ubiquinone/menaquinone biosynthesis C-methylase UbiE
MSNVSEGPRLDTRSRVIHWAFWYDVMLKVWTLGREARLRERFLDLAGVAPGQTILDAGCGPGTTAIAARRRVGAGGAVYGIDASPEMIERARQKASRRGIEVSFEAALLETLPFPDAKFDVVITSFVLHHFPADLLQQCLKEIRRVLKRDGQLVAIDFAASGHHHGLFRRHDHPHDTFNLYAIAPSLNAAGLVVRERGDVGFARAVFMRATPGASGEQREVSSTTSSVNSAHGLTDLAILATIATFAVSMIAVALLLVGKKWMWFGAGTAAAILAFHAATFHLGLGFGGASIVGYAARWFHRG